MVQSQPRAARVDKAAELIQRLVGIGGRPQRIAEFIGNLDKRQQLGAISRQLDQSATRHAPVAKIGTREHVFKVRGKHHRELYSASLDYERWEPSTVVAPRKVTRLLAFTLAAG
jgi:hypothetical protein